MDLDDLYESPKAPTRPSRFVPKGSKLKPNAEPGVSSSSVAYSIDLTKKEESESKPVTGTNPTNAFVSKVEVEASASVVVDAVAMDIDAKPIERGEPKDELMEIEEEVKEDEVVREIDVYMNSSIDPNTKVRVRSGSADIEIDLAVDLNSVEDEELNLQKCSKTNDQLQLLRLNKRWFQVFLYINFLLVGQSTTTVLVGLYHNYVGNSKWIVTFVEYAGFPIWIPFLFYLKRSTNPTLISSSSNSDDSSRQLCASGKESHNRLSRADRLRNCYVNHEKPANFSLFNHPRDDLDVLGDDNMAQVRFGFNYRPLCAVRWLT